MRVLPARMAMTRAPARTQSAHAGRGTAITMRLTLVLESLAVPTEAPRAARARDPTELLGDDVD
jgi:hypothetical protein